MSWAVFVVAVLYIPLIVLLGKAYGFFGKPAGKECGHDYNDFCDERVSVEAVCLIAVPMLTIIIPTGVYAMIYERARWLALRNPEEHSAPEAHQMPTSEAASDHPSQPGRDCYHRPPGATDLQQRVVIHPGKGQLGMAKLPTDPNSIFEPAPVGSPPYRRSPSRGNYEHAAPTQWFGELPF